VQLIGISGSLRRHSYNSGLLRAAREAMPAGATLTIASIAGVPLYNADAEVQGIPPTVEGLKDAVAAADGSARRPAASARYRRRPAGCLCCGHSAHSSGRAGD